MKTLSTVKKRKTWSRIRLLNLLIRANYDIFSIKGLDPEPIDIINWLDEYLKRETFGEIITKKKIEENSLN